MTPDRQTASRGVIRSRFPGYRREAFRTTLWVVPATMVVSALVLFLITYHVDARVRAGTIRLPAWAIAGEPSAARQVLIGIAAAVITVAGVVFSITILALQLASQQFGPRMLRNFIRDAGTQASLGAFVATFVYSVLTLGAVAHGSPGFVPHVSVTVALVLTLGDLGVLIYFIHHVASTIQLTSVVDGIARDFRSTVRELNDEAARTRARATDVGPDLREIRVRLQAGSPVPAHQSGFLQAVGHERLVQIATSSDAVISLLHRPGHFVVEGQPLALVWPVHAADQVSQALTSEHIVGANRTLTQDPGFAVDQLVEVAIRALSPAVNDTFTALNCVDWLGDCLCRVARDPLPDGVYRDALGAVRLVDRPITFDRLVKGASDKIRQAGRGMPAVLIRQLENLHKVASALPTTDGTDVIARHAEMILRASEDSVSEPGDRADVQAAFDSLTLAIERATSGA